MAKRLKLIHLNGIATSLSACSCAKDKEGTSIMATKRKKKASKKGKKCAKVFCHMQGKRKISCSKKKTTAKAKKGSKKGRIVKRCAK